MLDKKGKNIQWIKTYSTNGANKIEYLLVKNELNLYMLP